MYSKKDSHHQGALVAGGFLLIYQLGSLVN